MKKVYLTLSVIAFIGFVACGPSHKEVQDANATGQSEVDKKMDQLEKDMIKTADSMPKADTSANATKTETPAETAK